MNNENSELFKKYTEYMAALQNANFEQRNYGKISNETKKYVSDKWGDFISEGCVHDDLSNEQIMELCYNLLMYYQFTGGNIHDINIRPILCNLLSEIAKVIYSCPNSKP